MVFYNNSLLKYCNKCVSVIYQKQHLKPYFKKDVKAYRHHTILRSIILEIFYFFVVWICAYVSCT